MNYERKVFGVKDVSKICGNEFFAILTQSSIRVCLLKRYLIREQSNSKEGI